MKIFRRRSRTSAFAVPGAHNDNVVAADINRGLDSISAHVTADRRARWRQFVLESVAMDIIDVGTEHFEAHIAYVIDGALIVEHSKCVRGGHSGGGIDHRDVRSLSGAINGNGVALTAQHVPVAGLDIVGFGVAYGSCADGRVHVYADTQTAIDEPTVRHTLINVDAAPGRAYVTYRHPQLMGT